MIPTPSLNSRAFGVVYIVVAHSNFSIALFVSSWLLHVSFSHSHIHQKLLRCVIVHSMVSQDILCCVCVCVCMPKWSSERKRFGKRRLMSVTLLSLHFGSNHFPPISSVHHTVRSSIHFLLFFWVATRVKKTWLTLISVDCRLNFYFCLKKIIFWRCTEMSIIVHFVRK